MSNTQFNVNATEFIPGSFRLFPEVKSEMMLHCEKYHKARRQFNDDDLIFTHFEKIRGPLPIHPRFYNNEYFQHLKNQHLEYTSRIIEPPLEWPDHRLAAILGGKCRFTRWPQTAMEVFTLVDEMGNSLITPENENTYRFTPPKKKLDELSENIFNLHLQGKVKLEKIIIGQKGRNSSLFLIKCLFWMMGKVLIIKINRVIGQDIFYAHIRQEDAANAYRLNRRILCDCGGVWGGLDASPDEIFELNKLGRTVSNLRRKYGKDDSVEFRDIFFRSLDSFPVTVERSYDYVAGNIDHRDIDDSFLMNLLIEKMKNPDRPKEIIKNPLDERPSGRRSLCHPLFVDWLYMDPVHYIIKALTCEDLIDFIKASGFSKFSLETVIRLHKYPLANAFDKLRREKSPILENLKKEYMNLLRALFFPVKLDCLEEYQRKNHSQEDDICRVINKTSSRLAEFWYKYGLDKFILSEEILLSGIAISVTPDKIFEVFRAKSEEHSMFNKLNSGITKPPEYDSGNYFDNDEEESNSVIDDN